MYVLKQDTHFILYGNQIYYPQLALEGHMEG